jgi:ABC-type multidrug transport system fused ATPase/permease subunit
VLSLMVGGGMALAGRITPEQLTTFVLYVEFVTAASLSVCDQWGGIMESIGASERVMEYLDRPPAQQLSSGRTLPEFTGRVSLRAAAGGRHCGNFIARLAPIFRCRSLRPASWTCCLSSFLELLPLFLHFCCCSEDSDGRAWWAGAP